LLGLPLLFIPDKVSQKKGDGSRKVHLFARFMQEGIKSLTQVNCSYLQARQRNHENIG